MSTHTISATEASRSLSNILNKVHFQGESYEIKRGKEIIAKIIPVAARKSILPVAELNTLFKRLPQIESNDIESFEKDIEHIRTEMKPEKNPWD